MVNSIDMENETLLIKHMVCPRCIKVVTDELHALGLDVIEVTLGKAVYANPGNLDKEAIVKVIEQNGFELVQNPEDALVEQIRVTVIRWIREPDFRGQHAGLSLSLCLATITGKSYNHLSSVFSQYRKQTIEKFLIGQKIELAKELIEYGEASFTEIAYKIGYRSLQHLSNQFKTITGITMGEYKERKETRRNISDI